MFFRCEDLDNYLKESDPKKLCVLLVNKADFLSPALIKHWKDYFDEQKIPHFFFSAKKEITKIQEEKKTVEENPLILSKEALMKNLKAIIQERFGKFEDKKEDKTDRYTVGMVGYPNVGKSSVINVLCGQKKVSVSAQPGKTKHFQTIQLDEEDMTLCDCPGLVFPSFTNSKAEMICNGVISIDHTTEFDTSMILVAQRIPRPVLEQVYKLKLPNKETYMSANAFLQIVCRERGYVTGSALADVKKMSKIVLKDYVNGKLLYCNLRPDYDAAKHGVIDQSGVGELMIEQDENVRRKSSASEAKKEDKKEEVKSGKVEILTTAGKNEVRIDAEFFDKMKPITESKLNKEQKRQLKFAKKRGEVIFFSLIIYIGC